MRANDIATIEARPGSEDGWAESVENAAKQTLFHGTDSWYSGANIEGKHRQFIVHTGGQNFFAHIKNVADTGYDGFTLDSEDPNEHRKRNVSASR